MTPDASAAPAQAGIPPEVAQQLMEALQGVPEVQALLQKKVPAVSAPLDVFGENAQHVVSVLMDVFPAATGLDATVTSKSRSVVLFDPQTVTEAQLDEADAAGTLAQIAPPVSMGELAAAPAAPAAPPAAPQANPAAGLVSAGPQGASPAQVANLAPLPPTRQKNPAAGSIVNDLSKRAI
jgi:hypothetical protein